MHQLNGFLLCFSSAGQVASNRQWFLIANKLHSTIHSFPSSHVLELGQKSDGSLWGMHFHWCTRHLRGLLAKVSLLNQPHIKSVEMQATVATAVIPYFANHLFLISKSLQSLDELIRENHGRTWRTWQERVLFEVGITQLPSSLCSSPVTMPL